VVEMSDGVDRAECTDEPERIKFADELVPRVLNEEKTATVRYGGFAGVGVGDTLIATTAEGAPFADLGIRRTATAPAVEAVDLLRVFGADHSSEHPQDVLDTLSEHYDGRVNPRTNVRVLVFEVLRS